MKDLVKINPHINIFLTVADSIVNKISGSNKLIRLFTEDEDKQNDLRLLKSTDIWWYSVYEELKRIIETLRRIVNALMPFKRDCLIISGVLQSITHLTFLLKMAIFTDILAILSGLNKTLQNRSILIFTI